MESKGVKITTYILRGVAISLLLIAFLLLLIESSSVIETEQWGIHSSTYKRVDLDSEYTYTSHNFFERMNWLSAIGFSVTVEYLVIVSFVLALIAIVLSFFVKIFKKVYFAAVPLLFVVFCIVMIFENDTSYVIESDYLGMAYGYRIYEQRSVSFDLYLIPTIIMAFFAFSGMLVAGILDTVFNKKTATASMAADAVVAVEVEAQNASNTSEEAALEENLQ